MFSISSVYTIIISIVYPVFCLNNGIDVDIECIPLRDCSELFNLLKETPVSQQTVEILKTSHCGFEGSHPKVWCSQIYTACRTPDGKEGKCTPVKRCEPFLQVLKNTSGLSMEMKNYLQMFQCDDGNKSLSVCCPKDKKSLIYEPPTINNSNHLLSRPFDGECGGQIENKIIGGKITEIDEFPWTALLQYEFESNTVCAGSLINKRYVVTAAHCVDNSTVRSKGRVISVTLGEYDVRTEIDCINSFGLKECADPPVTVPVEEIIIHPEWLTKPRALLNHDIALLRLASDVTYTNFIKPICLPSPTLTLKEGQTLMVTGWGLTEEGRESSVKRKAVLPVANRETCVRKYKEDKNLMVGDGELCAGGKQGKDSCSGDSGGPLMLLVDRNGIGTWFLVGVVSFGPNQPCGSKNYPGLYTHLPLYVDWIYKSVRP